MGREADGVTAPSTIFLVWSMLLGISATSIPRDEFNLTGSLHHGRPCHTDISHVTRCIFTSASGIDDFKDIADEPAQWLELYFKSDTLQGILPNGSFIKVSKKQLKGIDLHDHYPHRISSRAFMGMGYLKSLTITRDIGHSYLYYRNAGHNILQEHDVRRPKAPDSVAVNLPAPLFVEGWLQYFHSLIHLHLQYNNIRSFHKKEFCTMTSLQVLDLRHNKLSAIDDIGLGCNDLESLPSSSVLQSLHQLDISNNIISRLVTIGPCGLLQLLILYVQNNRVTFISSDFFLCNKGLTELNLGGNDLSGHHLRSSGISQLNRLTMLDLSTNRLEMLDGMMLANMTQLVEFSCSKCGLYNISSDAFHGMRRLSILDLSKNSFRFLSKALFKNMKNLVSLNLEGNSLFKFEVDISLPSLLTLNLRDNNLLQFPELSGQWPTLTTLDVSSNNINKFEPTLLSGLVNLLTFISANNNISALPKKSFLQWGTNLLTINMARNVIQDVHDDAFMGIGNVIELSLEDNLLKDIPGWIMLYGKRLQHLNMSGNQIQFIDSNLLPKMIKTIDLSWNNISTIQVATLPLQSLLMLNVTHNNIKELRPENLRLMAVREPRGQVRLGDNPIVCNCQIDWLQSINFNRSLPSVPDLDDIYCKTPAKHTGRALSSLKDLDLLCPYDTQCDDRVCLCCQSYYYHENCSCREFCYPSCSCSHKNDDSINIMDCSSRNITSLPTRSTSFVKTLRLENNNITHLRSSYFRFPFVQQLHLQNSHVAVIEPGTFMYLERIKILYLQDNALTVLTRLTFHDIPQLEVLHLENNEIHKIEAGTFDRLYGVTHLFLYGNKMSQLNLSLFDQMESLTELTLHENPWRCDCEFGSAFKNWLLMSTISKKIVNKSQIHCRNEYTNAPQPILEIDFTYCSHTRKIIIGVGFLVGVLIVFGILVVLIHRNRLFIQILVYNKLNIRLRGRNEDADNAVKTYDLYLAHADEDEEFVENNLMPKLEQRHRARSYKVCAEYRDFSIDGRELELISLAVQKSKRTVLLLTEKHMGNMAQQRFDAAHQQVLADRQRRLILILKDIRQDQLNHVMKLYVQTGMSLVFSDPNFWNKLRYYLADNPRGADIFVGRRFAQLRHDWF